MIALIGTLLIIGMLTMTAKYSYQSGYDDAENRYKRELENVRKRIKQLEEEYEEKSV